MLEGIRELYLSRFLAGPHATLLLAGLGAEVIRIDDPRHGDPTFSTPPFLGPEGVSLRRTNAADVGLAYLKRCRSKKAITLDLKKPAGRALFLRLVTEADVVVENFRPGVMQRLDLDFAELHRANPRIVHCSISGYGATGPLSRKKSYDLMVQAASGLMSITGEPEGDACKAGTPLSDGIAGTYAVAGILAALLQRVGTGRGQFIDVSMLDCLFSLLFDEPLIATSDLAYHCGRAIASCAFRHSTVMRHATVPSSSGPVPKRTGCAFLRSSAGRILPKMPITWIGAGVW